MKKLYSVLAVIITIFLVVNTLQAQTTIKINDVSKPAVRTEVKASQNDVVEALENYFEKMNTKWRGNRGNYSTSKVSIPQLSANDVDLFFSINSSGRRNNEVTTVLMAVKPSADIFIGDAIPEDMFAKMSSYTNTFSDIVAAYIKQREIDKLTKEAKGDEKQRVRAEKKARKRTNEANDSKDKLEKAKSSGN